jgi:hypothetical protein
MLSLHTKIARADVVSDLLGLPPAGANAAASSRLASGEDVALFLVRGTALRAEAFQMGCSLTRAIAEPGVADVGPHEDALLTMLFSWAEHQVLVTCAPDLLRRVPPQVAVLVVGSAGSRAPRSARPAYACLRPLPERWAGSPRRIGAALSGYSARTPS